MSELKNVLSQRLKLQTRQTFKVNGELVNSIVYTLLIKMLIYSHAIEFAKKLNIFNFTSASAG